MHLIRCLNFWPSFIFWGAKSGPLTYASAINVVLREKWHFGNGKKGKNLKVTFLISDNQLTYAQFDLKFISPIKKNQTFEQIFIFGFPKMFQISGSTTVKGTFWKIHGYVLWQVTHTSITDSSSSRSLIIGSAPLTYLMVSPLYLNFRKWFR